MSVVTPKRIQRQRTKGWRMPEGAIYVGRPSRWGNPWFLAKLAATPQPDGTPWTAADVVRWYGEYARRQIDAWLAPLRGRDLACWCPLPCDEPVALYDVAYGDLYEPCAKPTGHSGGHDPSVPPWCHADVLLELANREVLA